VGRAAAELSQVQAAWRKTIPKIQYSVERNELDSLDISLARLNGALQAKSRDAALVEIAEAERHWTELEGRIGQCGRAS
jgi:multidrug efflux pump subunit AcrB